AFHRNDRPNSRIAGNAPITSETMMPASMARVSQAAAWVSTENAVSAHGATRRRCTGGSPCGVECSIWLFDAYGVVGSVAAMYGSLGHRTLDAGPGAGLDRPAQLRAGRSLVGDDLAGTVLDALRPLLADQRLNRVRHRHVVQLRRHLV